MSFENDPVFRTIQTIRTTNLIGEQFMRTWQDCYGQPLQAVRTVTGQTNYKPFERARMMVQATVVPTNEEESAQTVHLFLHILADGSAARQALEKAQRKTTDWTAALPFFCIPSIDTIAWILPDAPNMNELTHLLRSEHFRNILLPSTDAPEEVNYYPDPKLFRYVPLKRALLTWDDPYTNRRYFAKLYGEGDPVAAADNLNHVNRAFAAGTIAFAVPDLIAWNQAKRTILMTEVPGQQLTNSKWLTDQRTMVQVGHALAQLHQSCAKPQSVWSTGAEMMALRRHMRGLTLALPALEEPVSRLLLQLDEMAHQLNFPQDAPIHGNLFGDQILVHEGGIGIVDWDTLALGDGYHDIGRLLAHFIYLSGCDGLSPSSVEDSAASLLQAYATATKREIAWPRLLWHVATQLLLRGKISSLRPLPKGWEIHIAFVVSEATKLLDGNSQFSPQLHISPQREGNRK